jgi:GNAT superfamily N-acetyltransferase
MNDAGQDQVVGVIIRPARVEEVPALEQLIADSARELSAGYYNPAEIEAAIAHVFGVDSDLIADGTYFVAEEAGEIVGCGGWSRRRTLFGGDRFAAREPGYLAPATEAARIRAFFVASGHARKGVATRLLATCETDARAAGFDRAALMATLPGVPFYAAHGYRQGDAIAHDCGGISISFIPMAKDLLQK